MEKEGLARAISFLSEKMSIGVLVTDRHRQINKWIRETHPSTKHYYDVWHVVKGILSVQTMFHTKSLRQFQIDPCY